jgi:hypothetical protein
MVLIEQRPHFATLAPGVCKPKIEVDGCLENKSDRSARLASEGTLPLVDTCTYVPTYAHVEEKQSK